MGIETKIAGSKSINGGKNLVNSETKEKTTSRTKQALLAKKRRLTFKDCFFTTEELEGFASTSRDND